MTINLEHPAIFTDGSIVKLNEDFSVTKLDTTCKSVDFIRLIEEPIDLIPGGNDYNENILHLEPGDILLTFRDWDLNPNKAYYRFVIKSDGILQYLKDRKVFRKQQEEEKKSNTNAESF